MGMKDLDINIIEEHYGSAPQGRPGEVKIAKRLLGETTVTWKWIVQRLRMGASGCAGNSLRS
jgi:hypothetical protein